MKSLIVLCICLYVAIASPASREYCSQEKCRREDGCLCLSIASPLPKAETPQFVVITFDDAILEAVYNQYYEPLLANKVNPDGNPISATFFVPHKYTNYEIVNRLYNAGHEIGVHSISKTPTASYWANATLEELTQEFGGQKTIISTFGNLPRDHIKGARIPLLQMSGDVNIDAFVASNISYDSSWTTRPNRQHFPHTLDYEPYQNCLIGKCPTQPHPGFLISPIINFEATNEAECNVLFGCLMGDSTEEIVEWLITQFERTYNSTKAPQTFMLSSAWFSFKPNALEAFSLFMDYITNLGDVFLVSHDDVHDWMFEPIPLSEYSNPPKHRSAPCNPVTCALNFNDIEVRFLGPGILPFSHNDIEVVYMVSCVPCPDVYPWVGNPLGTLN